MDRQNTQPLLSDEDYQNLMQSNLLEGFSPLDLDLSFDDSRRTEHLEEIVRRHSQQPVNPTMVQGIKPEQQGMRNMPQSGKVITNGEDMQYNFSSTPPELMHAVPYSDVHTADSLLLQHQDNTATSTHQLAAAGYLQSSGQVVHMTTATQQNQRNAIGQQRHESAPRVMVVSKRETGGEMQMTQQQMMVTNYNTNNAAVNASGYNMMQQQQQQDPASRPWSPSTLMTTGIIQETSDEVEEDDKRDCGRGDRKPNVDNKESIVLAADGDPLQRSYTIDVSTLSSFPGPYNFSIEVPQDHKQKNKYCYCEKQNRLYCCPNHAMELRVHVDDWDSLKPDTSVRLVAVYMDPSCRTDPVKRCYNCIRSDKASGSIVEHMVQVTNSGAVHGKIGERRTAALQLSAPTLGHDYVTLLVKVMCRTTCVGGPNRRPFLILFSILDGEKEMGRYALPIKCCCAPNRDMLNETKDSSHLPVVAGECNPADKDTGKRRALPAKAGPSSGKRKTSGGNNKHSTTVTLSSDSDTDRSTSHSSKKQRPPYNLVTVRPADNSQLPHGLRTLVVPAELHSQLRETLTAQTLLMQHRGQRLASGHPSDVIKLLDAINK